MATLTSPDLTPVAAALRGQKLPRWAPAALAALGVVLGIGASYGLYGELRTANAVVLSAVLYSAVQTAASFTVEGRRQAVDRLFTTFVYTAFLLAALPLVLILWYTIQRGYHVISGTFLGSSMFLVNPDNAGGGIYHAIAGTLQQTLLSALVAVPLGVLTALYLVEYGGRTRFGRLVSFFVDVMTGVPSIVAGIFVYAAWLIALGFQKSGLAGALALAILMLPIVVRATEEMLKLVPADLREASYALGVPKWRTILKVVLPTALPGIVTGVMLGVARVMGETAPLILLVGTNPKINLNPFSFSQVSANPQTALPTYIWDSFQQAAGNPTHPAAQRAWGAALVLIALIMLLNLVARTIARFARARG
ncbi:MAG: phosphate transport system permease protein [Cryptosporangiaceae bacterium]|nr:phosphate transport system permease protein [Cryptosporangiaceae bacterium]